VTSGFEAPQSLLLICLLFLEKHPATDVIWTHA